METNNNNVCGRVTRMMRSYACLLSLLSGCTQFEQATFDIDLPAGGGGIGDDALIGAGAGGGTGGTFGTGGSPQCTDGYAACDGDWRLTCQDGVLAYAESCAAAPDGSCVAGTCEHGLVARWAFEEGSGVTATDDVGGLTGAFQGASWGDGAAGGGLDLAGGGYVDLGNVLHEPLPISLTAWVRVSSGASTTMVAISLDSSPATGYAGAWMSVHAGLGNTLAAGIGDATGAGPNDRNGKASVAGLSPQTWTHVSAVIHTPDAIDLYIDGAPVEGVYDGAAQTMAYTPAPALIGTANWGGADFQFWGSIDGVRVYRRALTPTDVARIASAP